MKDGQQCFKVRTAVDTWCTEDGVAKLVKQAAALFSPNSERPPELEREW